MYKDEPREGMTLVRMEVENRNTKNLCLPNGNMVGIGLSKITVYEDEVATVQELVEPNYDVYKTSARVMYENECRDFIKEKDESLASLPLDSPEVAAILKLVPSSIEGCFRKIMGRDLLPLASVRILETGIVPPTSSNVMARAIAKSQSGMIAEIVEEIMKRYTASVPAVKKA